MAADILVRLSMLEIVTHYPHRTARGSQYQFRAAAIESLLEFFPGRQSCLRRYRENPK